MPSVLFVCTANICRSPMAAAALRTILAAKGVPPEAVDIESAGTHPYQTGRPAHDLAIAAAGKRGYGIGGVARCIAPSDFDRFDHILVMDHGNLANLRAICPTRCKSKVELLLEYSEAFHGMEVPDPMGGKPADFERALDMIEDACKGLGSLLSRAA